MLAILSRRLISTSPRYFSAAGSLYSPGVDRRPDQLVGERRDPPRRPERVVVAQLHVGRRRRLRPPRSGIEPIALELADRRILDVVDRLPRAQREAEGEEALPRRVALVEVLPAQIPFVEVVAHAERRADVLQVVLDDRAAVLGHERVERVRRLEIGEVRPGAEDAQRAQLAAVLVRDEVVGIVGARAVVEEAARGSCRESAGRR